MNRIVTVTALTALISALGISTAFSAKELIIEFSGELMSTACQVAPESLNKEIRLENLHWRAINEQGYSYVTPFYIAIEKCNATDLQKSIRLTWKNSQVTDVGDEKAIPTTGSSGVYLSIRDQQGKPVTWNAPMTAGAVTEAGNQQHLNFGVVVRKPPQVEAKVGDFSSTVTFAVEYQ
ncbi:fimbrial protein [Morganella morganii]|uniref:fimbrial protein n=1 Tax=Morganella morganii TaxID=582 RepID=UPI001BD9F245|nr:fimbrial protein [Morganella morganii]EKT0592931.1 type 1 fimbrial protein [Morganella morganii]EKU0271157.1 type 1 fimbrial protein [Morganella morganii]ELF0883789.1 type 1 fimbrial protein [Morganella morganii]MBT0389000.1 type 1 fimbrial protein [Morganella morganii subsp. morganii]MBT0396288.1 type 1 fimbrial protein [Morganella morganii subsp. morganii]